MKVIGMVACGVVSLMISGTAAAQEKVRTVNVTGQGKASAAPDMATIQSGVVTRAETAGAALTANNKAFKQVLELLTERGIAEKDVQTSNFNVRPDYRRPNRANTEPEIVGYRVSNEVRVRIRKLEELGQIVDALVRVGSNQITGVSFGLEDPTPVLEDARQRAVKDARRRAELYADAAGTKLGRVLSISEPSNRVPPGPVMARGFAAEAAGAVPIATGEQELNASIQIVYELLDQE